MTSSGSSCPCPNLIVVAGPISALRADLMPMKLEGSTGRKSLEGLFDSKDIRGIFNLLSYSYSQTSL